MIVGVLAPKVSNTNTRSSLNDRRKPFNRLWGSSVNQKKWKKYILCKRGIELNALNFLDIGNWRRSWVKWNFEKRHERGCFHKIYYRFAVRFKYGTVIKENTLKSHCGSFGVRFEYLGSMGAAKMHVFKVDDETKLDHVIDVLRTCSRVEIVSHVYINWTKAPHAK